MDINYDLLLEELIEQEKRLQFKRFNSEDALEIGMQIINTAKEAGHIVAIDISINGHRLFYYAFNGTTPDNEEWIKRKCRVVNRFHTSSYRMGIKLKKDGSTLNQKYAINEADYAAHGGCFPIIIKDVGYVGTITVSGLPQEEDHRMVVTAIENYLAKNK